jgi:tetratricopeptide (TPR) repeat protein
MADIERITTEIHEARRTMLAGHPADALAQLGALNVGVGAGDFATLALVRGECLYMMGRYAEAKREFARCLLLAPNSPRAEIMLELASDMIALERTIKPGASIEQLLGEKVGSDDTIPAFHPTIEFEDESDDEPETTQTDDIGLVSETLAELMVRQGKFDSARKVYIQLSRLNPDKYEYFREKIERLGEMMNVE